MNKLWFSIPCLKQTVIATEKWAFCRKSNWFIFPPFSIASCYVQWGYDPQEVLWRSYEHLWKKPSSKNDIGCSSFPAAKIHAGEAMRRVEQFRHGIYYQIGKVLTAFPCNVMAFSTIYLLMMPLTARFLQNFDVLSFQFLGWNSTLNKWHLKQPVDVGRWNWLLFEVLPASRFLEHVWKVSLVFSFDSCDGDKIFTLPFLVHSL